MFKNFVVIGGGSWGTAIACHLARINHSVFLYARDSKIVNEINTKSTNSKYLANIKLPKGLKAVDKLESLKTKIDSIIIAVPSYSFSNIVDMLINIGILYEGIPILIASKGIATNPVQLFSKKIDNSVGNIKYAFIAGPNFATELANNQFTAFTISSLSIELANKFKRSFITDNVDITICDEIITTQIAGIVKNIIAIKSGIMTAANYGKNAIAWLITEGIKEIAIISQAFGGKKESIITSAVIGDLVLTASSIISRNTRFGYDLHKNEYSKKVFNLYKGYVVEGLESGKLISKLIAPYNLKVPVITSVTKILEKLVH